MVTQLLSNFVVLAARTIQYGYAQTGWKDLMTSYNGQSITYDEIGNADDLNEAVVETLARLKGELLIAASGGLIPWA